MGNRMKFIKALLFAAINTTKLSLALNLDLEAEASLETIRHRLCINPDTITMSGFSAGASFAHQMHIVHSETIKGVFINQGGPIRSELADEDAEYYKWADAEELR